MKIALTGKREINGKRVFTKIAEVFAITWKNLEASPGIEPGCKDLQSSA